MANIWTDEQKHAIFCDNKSVLVSAAAGSGKTSVLTERVISQISDEQNGIPADRFLIVTFSRAAATEMKSRISNRLSQKILENPNNKFLKKQQRLLNHATIATIDSFCNNIVKDNFNELGIPRNFSVADDSDVSILNEKAMELTLDEVYSDNGNNYKYIIENFSYSRSNYNIQNAILSLHKYLSSCPFPKDELIKLSDIHEESDFANTLWGKLLIDNLEKTLEYSFDLAKTYGEFFKEDTKYGDKGIAMYNYDIASLEIIQKAINSDNWNSITEAINNFKLKSFFRIDGEDKCDLSIIKVKDLRNKLKNNINKALGLFYKDNDSANCDVHKCLLISKELSKITGFFEDKLAEIKLDKKIFEFSDIEHFALMLLVSNDNGITITNKAKEIAAMFDQVMVDEYQDTNDIQDIIFRAVSNESENLFIVGDVKQSIYSFRQAEPEIFINRKEHKEDNTEKLLLSKNFRSRNDVLDSINFVFSSLMSKEMGDIHYNDKEKLYCGADFPKTVNTPVTVDFIEVEDRDDITVSITEASQIAKSIRKYMSTGTVADGGNSRKPVFGDFAVIMRNLSKYATLYINELLRQGIPAVSQQKDSFLDRYEISLAVNILRIIDNPIEDIPLLSVMMSPIYGFTPDEMALIRTNSRKTNLYTAVKKYAENNDEKTISFLRDIADFRYISVNTSLENLLTQIYENTSLLSVMKAINNDNSAVSNLILLREYAANFESRTEKGLSAFVRYINNIIKCGKDLPSASKGKDNLSNVVQVMTVHTSKGLEFPYVFFVNTKRQFVSESQNICNIDKELGISYFIRENKLNIKYDNLIRTSVLNKLTKKKKAEELRVLYVALTRAKEKLHIMVTSTNISSYIHKVSTGLIDANAIPPYEVGNASYISDWITMVSLIHPDAKELRHYADVKLLNSNYRECPPWEFNIIDTPDEEEEQFEDKDTDIIATFSTDESIDDIIRDRFNFVYKNQGIENIPVKVSVSELSHKDSSTKFKKNLNKPLFSQQSKLTATEIGTAYHTILEHIDFNSNDIDSEINSLLSKGFVSQQQLDSIDLSKISSFLECPIIKEAYNADNMYREYRFNVYIPASEVGEFPKNLMDTRVMLQGSVDLLYIVNGSAYIVDYKSDRVDNVEELAERYSKQVILYQEAIEKCLPYKVKKKYIYSITLCEYIEIE